MVSHLDNFRRNYVAILVSRKPWKMDCLTKGAIVAVVEDESGDSDMATVPCEANNLWQRAFQELPPENRKCLRFIQDDSVEAPTPAILISTINKKKEECDKKQWVLFTNKNGEKVHLRDVMGKICDGAAKFQKIGDAAVDYVPHAAVPWSIIKVLTQMSINDCETFGRLIEAVERISGIVAFYAELETRLLIRVSPLSEQLESSILKLYTAVLQFLARTYIYYTQRTAVRIAKSILKSAKDVVDEPMLQVDSLENDVFKMASIVSQECGNSMVESLLKTMKQNVMNSSISIAERRARLSARINGVHTQETLETALSCHHIGTCDWALQLDVFREWEADDAVWSKLLWMHGPPGFGKTVLSAWVIQHLRSICDDPVPYFFCVADNERTREPYAALRSWLMQILEKDATIDVMERVISGRKGDGPLTRSELWELFVVVSQAFPGFFFIMDGFDECQNIGLAAGYHKDDPRNIFLRDLVHHLNEAKARVLVVSRDVPDIREYLGETSMQKDGIRKMEYQITSTDTAADISAFSAHVVDQKLSNKKEKLRREIATEAADRSKGMFLWIQLLEKEIEKANGDNAKRLKGIVREMPSGISQAYARELDKIDRLTGRHRQQAITILRWVLFAVRPLQVKELAEALIVSEYEDESYPDDDLPDEWEECFVDEYYVKTNILGLGGSLLVLRPESSNAPLASHTVHFVHFSVKEYLTSDGGENSWAAKLSLSDQATETNVLSRVCLRYLTMDVFNEIPSDTRLYPFLSYASWAWYSTVFTKGHRLVKI